MIEYFSANLWQLWAIVALVCLILELMSGDFFIICFAFGAAAAIIAALCGTNLATQAIIFAIVSVLCIFFIRPTLVKKLHKSAEDRKSNTDALIGREAKVVETIEAGGHGRVKIDGDNWKAKAADGEQIEAGETVTVTDINSVILTVKR